LTNIGIIGGSFNPPTYAHLQLGVFAFNQFSLYRILLVPCSVSGFKGNVVMEDQYHRYNMTVLSSEGLDGFEVLDVDLFKGSNIYAYESINQIKILYPEANLYYIAGSDSIASVGMWKNPTAFVDDLHFVIANRESTFMQEAIGVLRHLGVNEERINELDYPMNNVSSTVVRKRLAGGLGCDCLTPQSVLRYISVHGLYEKEDESGR
jgi:nicotinate-nucleotide adenylyltransferase